MKDYSDIGLNSRLVKANSLAAKPRDWKSEFDQNAQFAKSPYGHPTQIHKGNLVITGGGTITVKDKGITVDYTGTDPQVKAGCNGYLNFSRAWTLLL